MPPRDREAERQALLDACRALVRLIYEEWPKNRTLEEIASIALNDLTEAELAALRRLPGMLGAPSSLDGRDDG